MSKALPRIILALTLCIFAMAASTAALAEYRTGKQLQQSILQNPRFRSFVEKQAREQGRTEAAIHKDAARYLNRIAADYRKGYVSLANRLLAGPLLRRMHVIKANKLPEKPSAEKRIVYLAAHQSDIDPALLFHIFKENGVPLHQAAGENLPKWPLRQCGAFFLKRSFSKADAVYKRVFADYMHEVLGEFSNVLYYPYGTRSSTGKAMHPKTGLQAMITEAIRKDKFADLSFAPISIAYDDAVDYPMHIAKNANYDKPEESLLQLFRVIRPLLRKYGDAHVKVHDAVSLAQMAREAGFKTDIKQLNDTDIRKLTELVANRLTRVIDRGNTITAPALVASALLNAPKGRMRRDEIKATVKTLLGQLKRRGAVLADSLNAKDLNGKQFQLMLDRTVQSFIDKGWVRPLGGEPAAYQVNDDHRPRLDIYKNNAISPLVPAALASVAILSQKSGSFRGDSPNLKRRFSGLQSLFKEEFVFEQKPTKEATEQALAELLPQALRDLVKIGVLEKVGENYTISKNGGHEKLRLFGGFLKPYLEAYGTTFSTLVRSGKRRLTRDVLYEENKQRAKERKMSPESVSVPVISTAMQRYGQPLEVGTMRLINQALTSLSGGGAE